MTDRIVGADGNENAIGPLIYHIAEAEMGWLWGNIKGLSQMPPDILAYFRFEPVDQETGRLTSILGVPLAEQLARLEKSRGCS